MANFSRELHPESVKHYLFALVLSLSATVTLGQEQNAQNDIPTLSTQIGQVGSPDIYMLYPFGTKDAYRIDQDAEGRIQHVIKRRSYNSQSSRDEQIALTHWNGSITVWNAQTGAELRKLNNGAVTINHISAAFGKPLILTLDQNHIAKVWDLRTGKERYRWTRCSEPVGISPDGTKALVTRIDSTSGLTTSKLIDLNLTKKEMVVSLSAVRDASFSPNSRRLLLIDSVGNINIWDLENGQNNENVNQGKIQEAFFVNDTVVMSYGKEWRKMKLFSTSSTSRNNRRPRTESSTTNIDNIMYSVNLYYLHDKYKKQVIFTKNPIRKVQSSPDGNFLLAILQAEDEEVFESHAFLFDVAFARYSEIPCSVDLQQNRKTKDTTPDALQEYVMMTNTQNYFTKNLTSIDFSNDGQKTSVGNYDGWFCSCDLEGSKYSSFQVQTNEDYRNGTINDQLYFYDDNRSLIFSGRNGNYKVKVVSGQEKKSILSFAYNRAFSPVNQIKFDGEGSKVLISRAHGSELWDINNTGKLIRSFPRERNSLVMSPSGKLIADQGGMSLNEETHEIEYEDASFVYNAESGALLSKLLHPSQCVSLTFTQNSDRIIAGYNKDTLRFWEPASGKQLSIFILNDNAYPQKEKLPVSEMMLSPNGDYLITTSNDYSSFFANRRPPYLTFYDLEKNELKKTIFPNLGEGDNITSIAFSPDSKWLFVGSNLGPGSIINLEDFSQKPWRHSKNVDSSFEIEKSEFLSNGHFVALQKNGECGIWNLTDTSHISLTRFNQTVKSAGGYYQGGNASMGSQISNVTDFTITKDRNNVYYVGVNGVVYRYNVVDKKEDQFNAEMELKTVTITPSGRFAFIGGLDGRATVWDISTGKELCTLIANNSILQRKGFQYFGQPFSQQCLVLSPEGRFDTNTPELIKGIQWTFPDAPFKNLPVELFFRDYYTPGLLSRLVSLQHHNPLAVPRNFASINHLRPTISQMTVDAGGDGKTVDVTVRISSEIDEQRDTNGKKFVRKSGIHDLRLFRDGKLVSNLPTSSSTYLEQKITGRIFDETELKKWRQATLITDSSASTLLTFKGISIPLGSDTITFSAYAFNNDRVKGNTFSVTYKLPKKVQQVQRKAFIVGIGVDKTDVNWNLSSAVNDVSSVVDVLSLKLKSQYSEVKVDKVTSKLSSQQPGDLFASKENIKATFEGLKTTVTPNDLLIIFFSGHGVTSGNSPLYLLPSNTGDYVGLRESHLIDFLDGKPVNEPLKSSAQKFLIKCISTEELSSWLRGIDAGEMILLIDACHSGAIVGPESVFRPGPLGDPGFGQLAYDKKIRVLVSAKANALSRGSSTRPFGYLTESLTKNANTLAKGWPIDFHEWLDLTLRQLHYNNWMNNNQTPELYDYNILPSNFKSDF